MEGVATINIPMWIFELFIFGFLVLDGALVAELISSLRKVRFKWLKIFALAVAVVAWGIIFYGSFVEPKILTVHESDIDLNVDNASGEFRVAVISDIHMGPYKGARWSKHVVEKLNELNVDMVWIAGDFIFSKTKHAKMLEPLKNIDAPVYAVLGNHDSEFADPDAVAELLEGWGLNMLRNRAVEVELSDGNVIDIAGIDDIWFTGNPVSAMETVDSATPTIMLAHNPDFILEPEAGNVDLVVSGHTHCGQIRLPWIGSVPPVPTKLGNDWNCGEYDYGDNGKLFVTHGVGETGPRARLFDPPAIDVLNIKY